MTETWIQRTETEYKACAVDLVITRKFLGYNISNNGTLRIAKQSINRLKNLDGWIRRKLRCYKLKQLKRTKTIATYGIFDSL